MKYWQYIGMMGCVLTATLVLSPKTALAKAPDTGYELEREQCELDAGVGC